MQLQKMFSFESFFFNLDSTIEFTARLTCSWNRNETCSSQSDNRERGNGNTPMLFSCYSALIPSIILCPTSLEIMSAI